MMLNWLKTHKLITILVLTAVIGGWYFFGKPKKVEYINFMVSNQTILDTIELSGKVKADKSASLRFLAGGLLTYLGPKEGDTVKKWQTLAAVDSRQLQKSMEQKLNLYSIQRGTFDQTIDDNDNSVPGGDLGIELKRLLEKNQYQLDNTIKDVEYQDLSLRLTKLVSPIDGILVSSPVSTSNVQVSASDVWQVVDPKSLYFFADLDETDLKRVFKDQKATIKLDAYPDLNISTTISDISYSPVETSTGTTYEVKASLGDSDLSKLRLGLNGTIAVILQEKVDVATLPASAVGNKDGYSYVYLKEGNKYIEQKIETGIENNGLVEIVNGVQNGQEIYQLK